MAEIKNTKKNPSPPEISEAEMKVKLEAAEMKKDQDALIVYNEAIKKIESMGRILQPQLIIHAGGRLEWKINIARKQF